MWNKILHHQNGFFNYFLSAEKKTYLLAIIISLIRIRDKLDLI
jgi:hypothetical protein